MGIKFLLTSIVLLQAFCSIGQEPPDADNYPVLDAQRVTANRFIHALESNQVDLALSFIDPGFLKKNAAYRSKLATFAKELGKYKDSTTLSVVIVWPYQQYNTYRCRYGNTQGTFFQMDLHFAVGNPSSAIQLVEKVPASTLKKDREELARSIKEGDSDSMPPLPPPPIRHQ